MIRRRSALALLACVALAAGGCRRSTSQPLPPPAVDLLAEADAAAEIVDPATLAADTAALLGPGDHAGYLAQRLHQLGLEPGGRDGWVQTFEKRQVVAAGTLPWIVAHGERRVSATPRDYVAALGGRWARVRLHDGIPLVFVAPSLAAPAGALAGKLLVVLDPPPAVPGGASPLPDLFRRAAAAGAHGVVVLPRPGSGAAPPSAAAAAQLAAGTGIPVALWPSDALARGMLVSLVATGLDYMPRLEAKPDILPLPLGTVQQLLVARQEQREAHRNFVALLPAREGSGAAAQAIALVAPMPGVPLPGAPSPAATSVATPPAATAAGRARTPAATPGTPPVATADPHARAAAAAELLGVVTAFQALSDPPRRTVVLAFTDPGSDGLEGARQLVADPRWAGKLAGALVLGAANLGGPTQDVVFVGAQASPLAPLVTRAAALQGRRMVPDPTPASATLWRSPAWALLQAGVPAVLLAPGVTPRPLTPDDGIAVTPSRAVAPVALRAQPPAVQPQLVGLLEDTRLAFRIALEMSEGAEAPRVAPQRVSAALQAATAASLAATPTPTPGGALGGRRTGAPGGRSLAAPSATPAPGATPGYVTGFFAPPQPTSTPVPTPTPPPDRR